MRIALVNGSLAESQRYALPDGFAKGFDKVIRPYQPLGLLSIAAVLLREGFDDILVVDPDAEGLSLAKVVRKLKGYNPELIGISCMSFTFLYCLDLARHLKSELESTIVIGGTHVAFYPREVLSHHAFDIGVSGDGESAFLGIARSLSAGGTGEGFYRRLHDVAGLVFREQGRIHQTAQQNGVLDLGSLPFPAHHLVDIRNYDQDYLPNPTATIITSRGCPFRCSFCSRTPWDHKDRYHSVEYVVDQIERIVDSTGARSLFIVDDTFTYHKHRAIRICNIMKERGLDLRFSALTRVTHLDREVMDALTGAGCRTLSLGIESGDQAILNKLCKGQTITQVRDAFRLLHQYDVDSIAYFMVGHPDEKREHIENTIRLIKDVRPDWFKANILVPYPGTALYSQLLSEGTIDDFWGKTTLEGKPYMPPNISRHLPIEELQVYRTRINLMPYTRLRGNNLLRPCRMKGLRNAALSLRWIGQCCVEGLRASVRSGGE